MIRLASPCVAVGSARSVYPSAMAIDRSRLLELPVAGDANRGDQDDNQRHELNAGSDC